MAPVVIVITDPVQRAAQQQQRRNLSIHEYQSYQLLNDVSEPDGLGLDG